MVGCIGVRSIWTVGAGQVRLIELLVSMMLSPRTPMVRAVGVALIPLVAVLPSVGVAVVPCRTLPMPAVSAAVGGAAPGMGVMPSIRPVSPGQGAGSTQGQDQAPHQEYAPPFFQVHLQILPF